MPGVGWEKDVSSKRVALVLSLCSMAIPSDGFIPLMLALDVNRQ